MYQWGLMNNDQQEALARLPVSSEAPAVPVSGESGLSRDLITLLAAAFSKGHSGSPVIPYSFVKEL